MKKICFLILLLFTVMLFVTGCSSDSKQDSENGSTVSDSQKDIANECKVITISELCDVNEEMLGETTFSLIYTLYDETSDGSTLEISDKSVVSEILNYILDIRVYNRGESMEMYVMRDEIYRFNSDSESFSFSFVPDSYFYYNNMYYEIYNNNLDKIHNIIEEYRAS